MAHVAALSPETALGLHGDCLSTMSPLWVFSLFSLFPTTSHFQLLHTTPLHPQHWEFP